MPSPNHLIAGVVVMLAVRAGSSKLSLSTSDWPSSSSSPLAPASASSWDAIHLARVSSTLSYQPTQAKTAPKVDYS